MSRRRTRNGLLMVIAALWLVGFTGIVSARRSEESAVTVVHWANGHMTRPGLLRDMAERFNAAYHTTAAGQRIVVQAFNYGSGGGGRRPHLPRLTRGSSEPEAARPGDRHSIGRSLAGARQ